jgi:DNA-binding Xre family transcriptional regulator
MTDFTPPIVRILHARGLRRIDLALLAGLDPKTVARVCRGEISRMKLGTLYRIAMALDVRPTDIVPALDRKPRLVRRSHAIHGPGTT